MHTTTKTLPDSIRAYATPLGLMTLGLNGAACDPNSAAGTQFECPAPSDPDTTDSDPPSESEDHESEDGPESDPGSELPEPPPDSPSPDPEDDSDPDPEDDGESDPPKPPPTCEPEPSPTRAYCVVAAEIVAECRDEDDLNRRCDAEFESRCRDVDGQLMPLDDADHTLPDLHLCDDDNPLLPRCNLAYETDCQGTGGALLVDRDLGAGSCAPDLAARAEIAGLSDATQSFARDIGIIALRRTSSDPTMTVLVEFEDRFGRSLGTFTMDVRDRSGTIHGQFDSGSTTAYTVLDGDSCGGADGTTDGDLSATELWERTHLLELAAPPRTQKGPVMCLLSVAAAVGTCNPPSWATGWGVIACGASVGAAACTCFEKEIKEKTGEEC